MADDVFGILGSIQADAFRVEDVVAEGGFAVIYRAYHQHFRADVALKCLKVPGTLSAETQEVFLERFRSEAELLFRLSGSIPSIVRPLHIGTLQTPTGQFAPFIALEWLNGSTLAELVDERHDRGEPPMTIPEVVELLSPVAHALARAHNFPGPDGPQSVLHRDLKPDNIFVARVHGEQLVKVLDFGIAKVKSAATQIAGRHSADHTTMSAFTPAYAAPEQWLPKRYGQTGPWTDVWGLALTAVEAICGRPPLGGDATAVMGSALDLSVRPTPRALGVEINDTADEVFTHALAVDPRQRFQKVTDFWTALEQAIGARPSHAVRRQPHHESLPPEAIEAAERMFGTRGPTRGAGELRAAKVPKIPGFTPSSPANARARVPVAPLADVASADPGRIPVEGTTQLGPNSHPGVREIESVAVVRVPELAISRPELHRERLRDASGRPSQGPLTLIFGMRRGLGLLITSAVIMGIDWAYTAEVGQGLAFGPVRPLWLAGPLAVTAVAIIVYTLVTAE